MINSARSDYAEYLFGTGNNYFAEDYLGAHKTEDGRFVFRVWAPAALSVSLVGDFKKALTKVVEDLSPDRIVIGEIRGGEALDLLQALNTGHAGSMSTIHANSPIDALSRIETCALLSGIDIPLVALRAQVASAIDAVIHTARLSDGSRKVVEVSEVLPLENGEYRVRSLRKWRTTSVAPDGRVAGTFQGAETPTFADEAKLSGLEI